VSGLEDISGDHRVFLSKNSKEKIFSSLVSKNRNGKVIFTLLDAYCFKSKLKIGFASAVDSCNAEEGFFSLTMGLDEEGLGNMAASKCWLFEPCFFLTSVCEVVFTRCLGFAGKYESGWCASG
jgi:hypothetical protein